jgi:small redox-active disulfide protein 2
VLTIKILGPGCDNCHNLEAAARAAAESLGADAEFIKVTDLDEIRAYPILATPGLVINERLVAAGRVPNLPEIVSLIATAMES